jgi:RNA-dependent RNA polymerase
MDLFMRNVAWAASERQLTRSLADILHGPDFAVFSTSGAPLNFRVTLYSAKGQQRHNGIGVLTVPRRDVGQHFLALYGGLHPTHFVFFASRRILWTESNKPSRPDILEHVQRMPYQDPASIEHQERIHQEYATGTIRLKQVQFGWECRDLEPTFSSEYERDCVGSGSLQFQDDPREISVRVREPGQTRIIAISIGCISTISVGMVNREPVIFFSLLRPPVYEAETTAGTQNGLSDMDDLLSFFNSLGFKNMAPTLRKRHVSFDQGHADTACYTSLAIRLVCAGENDLRIFRQLSSTVGIAERLQHNPPQMEKRELFAARVRAQFASWLQTVDWPVAYHLEAVTRSWAVDLPEILSLRPEIDSFSGTYGSQETAILLRTFATEVRELFGQDVSDMNGMETVSQCFKRCKTEQIKNRPKATRVDRNTDDIFDCYHIVIVPTSHMMLGPHPERLNRVIRKYHRYSHHFIRVSFEDEGRLQYRFHREVDGPDFIRRRVGEVLKNLTIAGLPIEFLAYSQSALKEHSVWYLRPFYDDEARCVVNAKRVIKDLGNFHNLEYDPNMGFCPARYAARISQSFTSTDSSISMEVEEVFIIDDIERNGSCFTDGVGTMSLEVSNEVNAQLYGKLRRRRRPLTKPRAYQIRLMGAKGMIAVDHKLSGRVVCVRRSMIKFDAPHSNDIEIAQAFDRPSRYYFNRPLIMLLEGLGVPYEVFEAYQRSAVQEVQDATHSLNRTARLLEGHGLGGSFRLPSVLQHLEQRLGIKQIPDPFYYRMQEFAVHHVLREMKHKARIPVPGGWILVGVADVHGYLGPREIFACTRCPDCRKDIYLEGPTMVSRSPTIHPGDVQVLQAIGRPPEGSPFASQPLKNCIVFSTEGDVV